VPGYRQAPRPGAWLQPGTATWHATSRYGRCYLDGMHNRREFCQLASFISVASLLEACGGSSTSPSGNVPALPTITGTISGGAVALTIDANSPLNAVGGAALVQTSSGNVLVAHTAQDTFVAVTAICTHQGCTVTGVETSNYICPCHGSRFSFTGSVVQGPASAPLRQFATRFATPTLTITIA
jgi:cytochrome b6-f complex iron-sulfur subunit